MSALKSIYLAIDPKVLITVITNPNKWVYANVLQVLNGKEVTSSLVFLSLLDLCDTNTT